MVSDNKARTIIASPPAEVVRSATARASPNQVLAIVCVAYSSTSTIELTWGLILASARHLTTENASLRAGRRQRSVGDDLSGRTLSILGLGNIGRQVARIGRAFGMDVT